ncbi:hypothetical protein ZTR_09150 [Talaromyces verruculosus]|nr:hypothetical protein ZTR_09150 [Talaromyces verruculosus]
MWRSVCSRPQGFDPDHEGYSGWQADDITRNNIVGWVQNTKPDIIQFMLGTNDVNIGHRNADSIIGSYTIMLNTMRAANPRVKVIVDKIIPTSWSDATIEAVNITIPGWVLQQTTAKSPVVISDCSWAAGFTNDMLRDDAIHPNSKGDQFIAGQIGPKLIQLIKDVSTGTTSSTSTSSTSPTSMSGGSGTGAAHWGQCGGIGWNGATTCVSPYTCQQINPYYYQCL